jgi:hypothetical protein
MENGRVTLFAGSQGENYYDTAEKLDSADRESILRQYRPWLVKDYGAANAWVVAVGPSPGAKRKKKLGAQSSLFPASTPVKHLVLGEVHDRFTILSQEKSVFWRNLFGALELAFKKGTSVDCGGLNHLKAVLTTNLSPRQVGNEAELTEAGLVPGVPHLLELLRLCKPRVVGALTKRVYRLLATYIGQAGIGARLTTDDRHIIKNGENIYKLRSCWMNVEGVGRILLVQVLHPRQAGLFRGRYIPSVGAYLGRRFREALEAELQPEPLLGRACETLQLHAG